MARVDRPVATQTRVAWLAVLLFPILINSPKLLGILNADPVSNYSYLRAQVVPGPLPVYPEYDPSVGVVFQPLGYRSAEEMVHGKLPWWNSLQGVGAPLAGAMSTGSFFPLVFLQLLPNGQVDVDVAVQILAGTFMLLLGRRLGLGTFASSVGALLFELNGTIAWLNAGWCYPLPFLPMLVYGVELAIATSLRERIAGTIVVAVAVAASISAAMIEVAYLDGLLAVCWALLRLAQTRRSAVTDRVLRLFFGGALGLLLATPLLIAFGDFVSVAYVGGHDGGGGGPGGVDVRGLPQLVLPYILGEVFYNDSGYGGVFLILMAVCGLFGPHLRGLRLLLGSWIFVAVSVTMGIPYLSYVFYWIPGVRYTAYGRYLDGSWEFALALLAAFFVYDLSRNAGRLWVRSAVATATVLLTLWIGISGAFPVVRDSFSKPQYAISCWSSVAWCGIAIALLWVSTLRTLAVVPRMAMLATIVVAEACVNYTIPMLGFPRHVTLAEGSVDFLREHLGLDRVFALNTLAPNYGTYFHVAELDDAELPVARNWADYISTQLDTLTNQGWINGQGQGQLGRNIYSYEDAGMKYLMTTSGTLPYDDFDEPLNIDVAARPINLIDTGKPLDVRIASVPLGSLASVSLVQGNYSGTADGQIHLHVCSDGRCVDGYRPLSESPNNAAFWVNLERPLVVTSGSITITIGQERGTINDAVWLYGRDKTSNETVAIAGKLVKGYVADISLAYDSVVSVPSDDSSVRTAFSRTAGETTLQATVPLHPDVAKYVTEVVMSGVQQATIPLSARVCSLGECVDAVPSDTRPNDRDLWFMLPRELRAKGSVTVMVGHVRPSQQPIRVRVGISTERPSLVYHDAVADVFQMPHPSDYFSAPDCVLVPQARERVTAECLAPSRLIRHELYLPGWTATLNGRRADVTPVSTIYQSVALPAGESSLEFAFEPPYMSYGYAAFTLALLVLGYQTFAYVRLGRRRRDNV